MMGRALLIIGALAMLGFLASGVLGYLLGHPGAELPRHVFVALAACLAQLFSQCWILIYLLLAGRAIRETAEKGSLDARFSEEPRRLVRTTVPWLLAAVILGLATFLVGGATATATIKQHWIHHALFYATLAVQGWALWQASRALRACQTLIDEIDGRLAPEVAG